SSSSPLIDKQTIEGGPGQDIGVAVGDLRGTAAPFQESAIDDALQLSVEVSNNSDADIVVKRIAISPIGSEAYRIDPASQGFNETIAEGEDHLFTLNIRGRQARPLRPDESSDVTLRVVVTLGNGDSYFYSFGVPVLIGRRRS
ncbi:MAG TPA: hypothetical protein VMU84_11585, partial [Thermoanaerobaculia bacterium]|nr:hypothetical protein [Thermoanaerobaculia bacterium]